MESAIAKLVEILLQHGLAGAFIVTLTVAVVLLWRELQECRKVNVAVSGEVVWVTERNTAALNILSARDEARNQTNQELKEVIVALRMEAQATREYLVQLAESGRDRFEQLQRDIARER